MKEYEVLQDNFLSCLIRDINEMARDGWKPYKRIRKDGDVFMQFMVRESNEDKDDTFFARGNFDGKWKNVNGACDFDVACVVVDECGHVYAHNRKPCARETVWVSLGNELLIGAVGQICPDWRDLIFYPPQDGKP